MVAHESSRTRTWAESYKNEGLHLRSSAFLLPPLLPRQRTRGLAAERELDGRRGEKPESDRIREGRTRWSGANSRATMRRSSKKSSSSTASATAGNVPSPDPCSPPPILLFLDRFSSCRREYGFGLNYARFGGALFALERSNLEAELCGAALVGV